MVCDPWLLYAAGRMLLGTQDVESTLTSLSSIGAQDWRRPGWLRVAPGPCCDLGLLTVCSGSHEGIVAQGPGPLLAPCGGACPSALETLPVCHSDFRRQ
jgi:hypothetical protein